MSSFTQSFGALAHLTTQELFTYLPNFIAECDPQVGEWVLITPVRRRTLLDPLIQLWEGKESGDESSGHLTGAKKNPKRYSLSTFVCDVGGIQLAPLSVAMLFLCDKECTHSGDSSVPDNAPLYLHVRLGLLTASTPSVFGGEDNIKVIIIQPDCARPQAATLYIPPVRTFTRSDVSSSGVRTQKRDKAAVMASISPSSASCRESIEANAHQEWVEWQRHHW
ncbi:unnamed protein product [Phytomonas sp. Hart1]|nr:unnamed protein product [Phytomonas sp. Hart1]|eukprot:CCW70949.1 unnamed protein product [Phytomonas sp. isolate Hart1]